MGLAKLGIVALVDEATGYQEARGTDELQALLDKYVQEDFRPWVRVFPDTFFSELYRIYNWTYEEGRSRHPQYVGQFINAHHLPAAAGRSSGGVTSRQPKVSWREPTT